MANEEHVKILEQGVEAWNSWRDENPDVLPDFRGARPVGGFPPKTDLTWVFR